MDVDFLGIQMENNTTKKVKKQMQLEKEASNLNPIINDFNSSDVLMSFCKQKFTIKKKNLAKTKNTIQ